MSAVRRTVGRSGPVTVGFAEPHERPGVIDLVNRIYGAPVYTADQRWAWDRVWVARRGDKLVATALVHDAGLPHVWVDHPALAEGESQDVIVELIERIAVALAEQGAAYLYVLWPSARGVEQQMRVMLRRYAGTYQGERPVSAWVLQRDEER